MDRSFIRDDLNRKLDGLVLSGQFDCRGRGDYIDGGHFVRLCLEGHYGAVQVGLAAYEVGSVVIDCVSLEGGNLGFESFPKARVIAFAPPAVQLLFLSAFVFERRVGAVVETGFIGFIIKLIGVGYLTQEGCVVYPDVFFGDLLGKDY